MKENHQSIGWKPPEWMNRPAQTTSPLVLQIRQIQESISVEVLEE
jgi:hypothetical protein